MHGTATRLETLAPACGPRLAWTALAAAWLFAHHAHAEASVACNEPRIHVESELAPAWVEPVTQLCAALASMPDADPSVQLRILAEGDELRIDASSSDGRATTRRVRSPQALRHQVEALVLLPVSDATPPVSRPSTTAPASRSAPSDASAAPTVPAALRIELGGSLIARVSRTPTYAAAGLGVHAGIRPGAWLLALTLRWEPFEALLTRAPAGFEMESFGAGFLISRQLLRIGWLDVDLGVSSLLAAESQSFTVNGVERTGSATDVQTGLFSRWLFGASALRWTLSLEAELSPLRLRRDLHIDRRLPKLPTWGLGLGLGVAWSES